MESMKMKFKQFWNNCTKEQKYFLLGAGQFVGTVCYVYTLSPIDLIFLTWETFCSYGIGRIMNGGW